MSRSKPVGASKQSACAGCWTGLLRLQAAQVRERGQRPFSRAYRGWSEAGYAAEGDGVGDGAERGGASAAGEAGAGLGLGAGAGAAAAAAGGWSRTSAVHKARSLFGETLQAGVTKSGFKSSGPAKAVTAGLVGKDSDAPLVAALQRLYVEQVVRDSAPRLRADPDLAAAGPERFPHCSSLLAGK